jgi:HK97 gp10 family phage protein
MSQITIEAPGFDDLIRDFSKAPDVVGAQLKNAVRRSAVIIQREAIKESPIDQGILRSQINVTFPGEFSATISSDAKYSIYIHEGTPPHKAPWAPIAAWAKRKGLPAFPIWYSIQQKGTKANPFMKRAAEKSENDIQGEFNTAVKKVAHYLANGES